MEYRSRRVGLTVDANELFTPNSQRTIIFRPSICLQCTTNHLTDVHLFAGKTTPDIMAVYKWCNYLVIHISQYKFPASSFPSSQHNCTIPGNSVHFRVLSGQFSTLTDHFPRAMKNNGPIAIIKDMSYNIMSKQKTKLRKSICMLSQNWCAFTRVETSDSLLCQN